MSTGIEPKEEKNQPNYKCNITCCARIDCRRPNARSTGDWLKTDEKKTGVDQQQQQKNDGKNGFSFFLFAACCDEKYAIKTMEYAKPRDYLWE